MMKATITSLLLLLGALLLYGEDITTLKGEKFVGVTISRIEPDGIVVLKSDGIVKIPFTDLSPELRAKYGYDPEKATEFSSALRAADAQRQAEVAKQQAAANAVVAAQQHQERTQKRIVADAKELHVEVIQ